ncbi:MAG: DVUA0089 family protein [Planctomycetaceae bacterium]
MVIHARRDTAAAPRGRSRPHRQRRHHALTIESLESRLTMAADFGDSIAAARVFTAGTAVSGRIGDGAFGSRDVDLVGVTVAAGGRLTVDIDARSLRGGSTLDSYLRVFDRSGRVVVSNDDHGGSLDSYVSVSLPTAGTYYVGVSGWGNAGYDPRRAGSGRSGSVGVYAATITVANPAPVDTAGDSIETARDIGRLLGGVTIRETIGGTDRSDVFRFTLSDRARVGLRLDGLASNADLALVDAGGQWITTSTQAGTAADLIERELRPGTYYAEVRPFDGSTNYTLTLSSQVVWPTFSTPQYRDTNGWGFVDAAAAVAKVQGLARPFPDVPYQPGDDPGIDLVNAPAVWAQGHTGAGTVVAVLDTGVDYNHPDLFQNIWVNPREIAGDGIDNDQNGFVDDVRGWDFVDNDAAPMDIVEGVDWRGLPGNRGHGTHVAGTIAAARNGIGSTGVAPDARIMPVRVLFNRDADNAVRALAIARGIRYAADNGAHVINMSLGGGPPSSAIEQALRHATSRGCVVVIAAGNWPDPTPANPANLAATIDGVIAVGATEHDRSLASFSARSGPDSRMQYVTAPGVSILSTLPGNRYGAERGTSMAAPHVAGVVALMRSALTTASPNRYWAHVTGTARQLPVATVRAAVTVAPDTATARGQFAALTDGVAESGGRRRAARPWL